MCVRELFEGCLDEIYVCMCINNVYVFARVYVFANVFCMCTCMYVCMYVYIDAYISTYMYDILFGA